MTKEELEDIKKIGIPSEELYQELCNELLDYKQLEEQIGFPVKVYAKIQLGLVDTIYVKRYETVRKYWNEEGLQLEQRECLCPRHIIRTDNKSFYYQDILGKESMGFCEYGTEFWLREDKSE